MKFWIDPKATKFVVDWCLLTTQTKNYRPGDYLYACGKLIKVLGMMTPWTIQVRPARWYERIWVYTRLRWGMQVRRSFDNPPLPPGYPITRGK